MSNVHLRLEDNVSGEGKVLVSGAAMEKLLITSSSNPATMKVKFRPLLQVTSS